MTYSNDTILSLALIVMIAAMIIGIYLALEAERDWQAFKIKHNCQIVAKTTSTIVPTFSYNTEGNLITSFTTLPSKTTYLCDDNVTYTR